MPSDAAFTGLRSSTTAYTAARGIRCCSMRKLATKIVPVIKSSDLERSVRFYTEVLILAKVAR